ncbi:YkoP family protein [Alkalibacter saccharofermentans]|uniref:YkoP-like domain-containing protein n=1 Tax=Alkalibacter saccharofermentans DSM 14828 TaxID=1120975 RepID=A0A1M4ZND0_9FIRM|nr:hypothetical protein [Alkalibacter saccharofermentans]SHF19600.1 hypothetical protein SAMN02746064_02105 [Alkalibacter saccharofermentans DSM 14828]
MVNAKALLNVFEKYLSNKEGWQLVPGSKVNYIFLSMKTYRGSKRTLADGTVVSPGDRIGEFHVNNNNMPRVDMSNFRQFNSDIKGEFVQMGKILKEGEFHDCKAFFGRTILYPFVLKYGFEIFPIEKRSLQAFLNLWDRLIYHAYTQKKGTKHRSSQEVWISAARLIELAEE